MKISQKTVDVVATGLRTTRPWRDDTEYLHHQPLRDAGYYMFLTWDLTVNQIADGLRNASGFKFDRNQFMRDCGAYKYTCQRCYCEVLTSDAGSKCDCNKAAA